MPEDQEAPALGLNFTFKTGTPKSNKS